MIPTLTTFRLVAVTILLLCTTTTVVVLVGRGFGNAEPPVSQSPAQILPQSTNTPTPVVPVTPSTSVEVAGVVIHAAPGQSVDIETDNQTTKRQGRASRQETSRGLGTGLTTTSESVSQKFKAEAPSATAGKAGASGGGFTYDGQLLGGGSINIFYVFGAVLLVTAVLFVALIKPPRWGTAGSFAAGAAVFVGIGVTIDKYPWIWLAGVGVLFALFLFWVIKARMNTKVMAAEATRAYALDTTLSTMVKAIHTAPSDTKNAIKDRIRTTATGSDQRVVEATISKIKARENL